MLPIDLCMTSYSSITGGKLEKGPAALLSCLEGILRTSAPLPGGSLLSPGPHASVPRLARSTTASPVRPPIPQQAPLPATPGTVVMEDDPPGWVPSLCHCSTLSTALPVAAEGVDVHQQYIFTAHF